MTRTGPTPRMPAEFEPHARTVMCWPARVDLYGEHLPDARAAHATVASTIADYEPVTMIAAPGAADCAAAACGDAVDIVELPLDDSWFRDSGPIYVLDREGVADGEPLALDWIFNAWGEKFHPYADDAALAARWAEHAGHRVRRVPMVLEGGSIAVDGDGTLVTTSQCLLNPNRNPHLTRAEIEAHLTSELGVSTVIWLPYGLAGDDDTDGHVDNIAAFAAPGRLLVQGCDDRSEDDWLRLAIDAKAIRGVPDAADRPIEVVDVPVLPYADYGARRVAVPYLNFYVANGVVVVPVCGHDADDDIVALIGEQFPGRDTVAVDVGAVLAYGGGGVHCITQQLPA